MFYWELLFTHSNWSESLIFFFGLKLKRVEFLVKLMMTSVVNRLKGKGLNFRAWQKWEMHFQITYGIMHTYMGPDAHARHTTWHFKIPLFDVFFSCSHSNWLAVVSLLKFLFHFYCSKIVLNFITVDRLLEVFCLFFFGFILFNSCV